MENQAKRAKGLFPSACGCFLFGGAEQKNPTTTWPSQIPLVFPCLLLIDGLKGVPKGKPPCFRRSYSEIDPGCSSIALWSSEVELSFGGSSFRLGHVVFVQAPNTESASARKGLKIVLASFNSAHCLG